MFYRIVMCSLALLGALNLAHAQDVYKWTDESGKVHYGDAPSDHAKQRATKVETKIHTPTDEQRGAASERAGRIKQSWGDRMQKEAARKEAEEAMANSAPPAGIPPTVIMEAPTQAGTSCEAQKQAYEAAAACFEAYRSPSRVVDQQAYSKCPNVKKPAC